MKKWNPITLQMIWGQRSCQPISFSTYVYTKMPLAYAKKCQWKCVLSFQPSHLKRDNKNRGGYKVVDTLKRKSLLGSDKQTISPHQEFQSIYLYKCHPWWALPHYWDHVLLIREGWKLEVGFIINEATLKGQVK